MANQNKMNSKIPRSKLKDFIIYKMWAISAGRCELCNKKLYQDSTLGFDGNFAENAHIHAVGQNGPRHKDAMTEDEINSSDNLMLLCEEHHHLIDTKPDEYTEGILLRLKTSHESRIEVAASITNLQSSRIVSYFSNVDLQKVPHDDMLFKEAIRAQNMLPLQFPTIKLHDEINTIYEASKENYLQKSADLERNFKSKFEDIVEKTQAISVFSLAPQPLLIKLGTLINDQYNSNVFQCHRNGHKWAWKDSDECPEYIVINPVNSTFSKVALVIDLSAKVLDDRIISKLGDDIAIYHITIENPNRYFVTNSIVQHNFATVFRNVMEQIKNMRPKPHEIHLFPVMPNSLAIKLGMDYMPKTDLPLIIYDEDKQAGGFFETITIGEKINDN